MNMATALAFLYLASANTVEPPKVALDSGYSNLVFSDEFDGDSIDSHWYRDLWFQKPTPLRHFNLSHGLMTITTNSETGRSGMSSNLVTMSTAGGRSFHYGYFEARMRWPIDRSNWADFWLLASKAMIPEKEQGPYCEIDIVEALNGLDYSSMVHDWVRHGVGTNIPVDPHSHFFHINPEEWHTFGLLWKKRKISFFLDEKKMLSLASPKVCDDDDTFLIIGAQTHKANVAQSVDFDWVRVWQ